MQRIIVRSDTAERMQPARTINPVSARLGIRAFPIFGAVAEKTLVLVIHVEPLLSVNHSRI